MVLVMFNDLWVCNLAERRVDCYCGGGTGTREIQISSALMAYCVARDSSSCNSQNASLVLFITTRQSTDLAVKGID